MNSADKSDLSTYVNSEPFRVFASCIEDYKKVVVSHILTAQPDKLQMLQGVLKGLHAATNVLQIGATNKDFLLDPVSK